MQEREYKSIDIKTYQPKKSLSIALKSKDFLLESNTFQMVTSVTNPYACLETKGEADILYINDDYFINNYEKVLSELCTFIRKYVFSRFIVSSTCLITKSVLNEIRNNRNIIFLTLGNSSDPYTLTKEIFDFLNESPNLFEINSENVEGKFEDQDKKYISWFNKKRVCGLYNIIDLEKNTSFYFDFPLHDEEIEYLSTYLANGSTLNFSYLSYDNIIKVIKALKGKNLSFHIMYTSDITKYDDELLDLIHYGEKITLNNVMDTEKVLQGEKLLDLFIKDIKTSSLSPYRKYLAVYKLVKSFKKYQKNPKEKFNDSRDVYQILFNEYIVCEGYVNLLVKLLDKVGICAMPLYCTLKKEKEIITLEDEATLTQKQLQLKMGDEAYHARVLVHLIDEEFDINGIYIADPTWDNEEDSYEHAHMTPFETTLENANFKKGDVDFLNVNSSGEFLDKVMNNKRAICFFKEMLYQLDLEFYTYMDRTYDLDNLSFPPAFYLDLYNYIISFTKKRITDEQLSLALKDVFRFIYIDISEIQLDELVQNIKTFKQNSDEIIVRR